MLELLNGIHSIAVRSNVLNDALEPEEVQSYLLPLIEEHFIALLTECDGDIEGAWVQWTRGFAHIDITYALEQCLEERGCALYDGASHICQYDLMRRVISDRKVLGWLQENDTVQDLHYAYYVATEECCDDDCCYECA